RRWSGDSLARAGARTAQPRRPRARRGRCFDPWRGAGRSRPQFYRPHRPSRPGRPRAGPRSVVLKPTRAGLTRASQLIREGGVIAFPTDTVYGLGAAADDELATRRVYQIKGRPAGLPLILMVAAESQLEGWVHV